MGLALHTPTTRALLAAANLLDLGKAMPNLRDQALAAFQNLRVSSKLANNNPTPGHGANVEKSSKRGSVTFSHQ